jgi:hypothetical protein
MDRRGQKALFDVQIDLGGKAKQPHFSSLTPASESTGKHHHSFDLQCNTIK